MNWQPIETAPKDRRILLYYQAMKLFVVGKWGSGEPRPYWTSDRRVYGVRWHRENTPSHWAELVPPNTTRNRRLNSNTILTAAVLGATLMMAAPAQAFRLCSNANPSFCVAHYNGAAPGGPVIAWYNNSSLSVLYDSSFNADGHLKFWGTNLCVHANTATTVIVATCANTSRQRWLLNRYKAYPTFRVYNDAYGAGTWLYWNGHAPGAINQTTTYPTSPTRFWQ